MKILDFRRVVNLTDYFRLYECFLQSEYEASKAKLIIAKTKTSLVRFTLHKYGFPLKLDGKLLPSEMIEGLRFMEQIPICQSAYLLEAQEEVFTKFSDQIPSASRRVYRSALKKMIDWGTTQDWWQQSVAKSAVGRTPTMLIFKKRVEHWHKLKPEDISVELSQQLDLLSAYLTTVRQPCLKASSYKRYHREVLGVLGWLHRIKGIAISDLSLTYLVPVASIYDQAVAEQVVMIAEEYLEWMRANL
jgi:hypothetical protein